MYSTTELYLQPYVAFTRVLTRKRTQITEIRNERGDITNRSEYYELYANNFDDLHEIEKFLERHKLLKLIEE
jgi:hypothetical protein